MVDRFHGVQVRVDLVGEGGGPRHAHLGGGVVEHRVKVVRGSRLGVVDHAGESTLGYERIRGELRHLGHRVSGATIRRTPMAPMRCSQGAAFTC